MVLQGLDASGKDGTIKVLVIRVHPELLANEAIHEHTARAVVVIPADHKWFLRTAVAAIIVQHLSDLDPQYPTPSAGDRREMQEAAAPLRAEE